MPNLKIEYNGAVLHDGDVDELTWTDAPGVVTVVGKLLRKSAPTAASGQGLGSLLGALAGARPKGQAADAVRRGRRQEFADDADELGGDLAEPEVLS